MNKRELQPVTTYGSPVVASIPTDDFIKSRIFTIRGVQVMLDRDLAALYGVETSRLNEQVKRNEERFPETFMFQLTKEELAGWISQNATSNFDRSVKMGLRKLPRAFTEHGIIMLASVLRSGVAVATSIRVTNAFVSMRRTLASMSPLMTRLETIERRQITDQTRNEENQQRNEERFDTIFKAMDGGDFPPQKVFFDGKHYDAHSFAKKLVRKATKRIVLVDGYCDEVTLDILAQKKGGVEVLVATAQKMIDNHLTPAGIRGRTGRTSRTCRTIYPLCPTRLTCLTRLSPSISLCPGITIGGE